MNEVRGNGATEAPKIVEMLKYVCNESAIEKHKRFRFSMFALLIRLRIWTRCGAMDSVFWSRRIQCVYMEHVFKWFFVVLLTEVVSFTNHNVVSIFHRVFSLPDLSDTARSLASSKSILIQVIEDCSFHQMSNDGTRTQNPANSSNANSPWETALLLGSLRAPMPRFDKIFQIDLHKFWRFWLN